MESGLYITFFETGEPFERELPPVGPLDHVIVRHRQLVADRAAAHQAPDLGANIARWLEAELELQRALGEEPGGTKRSELRVAARDGVFLRFVVFGDARERDPMPELGPYAVVVVGRRGVEADGQVLATRQGTDIAPWELTFATGDDHAGMRKPDIAFRSAATSFHASIAPVAPRPRASATEAVAAPPLVEPDMVFTHAPREIDIPEPTPGPPPADETPALTPQDLELIQRIDRERAEETLRARIQEEERRRLGVAESGEAASTWSMRYRTQPEPAAPDETAGTGGGSTRGAVLWRLRFAIIGLLLVGAGAYGFTVIRSGGTSNVPGQQQIQTVGIAQKVSSARWDYVVNGVQRLATSGSAKARGTYYVVRLGVTNRGTEGAQLSPSDFVLVDANGVEYRAESTTGGAYYGSDNTQSQFVWPQSFGVGRSVTIGVIFDVDPALGRGNQLAISDLPRTRVKLD
jgi:hypothetical protein